MSLQIALSSACQRLSQRMARSIAQRMAADGSGLLILRLVNSFHDGLPCIAQRMAADFSFLHSSMAFTTVLAPYFSADSGGLFILSLVNGFHDGLRAVLLTGWQRIAHTSARKRLSRRIAHRIAQRMAADCSYFHSSKAFTTDCAPYCSADGSALLLLPFVKGFHDRLRAVLLSGSQRIAHTSVRQRLSRRIAHPIAQRIAAYCSYFRSSMAFTTVCAPYCSADGSGLLVLPLVNRFHNDLRAVSHC